MNPFKGHIGGQTENADDQKKKKQQQHLQERTRPIDGGGGHFGTEKQLVMQSNRTQYLEHIKAIGEHNEHNATDEVVSLKLICLNYHDSLA